VIQLCHSVQEEFLSLTLTYRDSESSRRSICLVETLIALDPCERECCFWLSMSNIQKDITINFEKYLHQNAIVNYRLLAFAKKEIW